MQRQASTPTALTQFALQHQGDSTLAEALVNTFLNNAVPPAQHFPPQSIFRAKEYEAKQKSAPAVAVLGAYLSYALRTALPDFYMERAAQLTQAERVDLFKMLALYNAFNAKERSPDNIKLKIFSEAAFYQFTKTGACAKRACYAALQLHKLFANTDIEVHLESSTIHDHFFVVIGNQKMGRFVYDALTNPVLLFTREQFDNEVLAKFTKVAKPAAVKMQTQITTDLTNAYENQYPEIAAQYTELLCAANYKAKDLLRDENFVRNLKLTKCPKAEWKQSLEKAMEDSAAMSKSAATLRKSR